MPSSRRGSNRASDRSFYDRSVAGMARARSGDGAANAPNNDAGAASSPQVPLPAPGQQQVLKDSAGTGQEEAAVPAGRQPPQVALGEGSDSKRVKGGDRWKSEQADDADKKPASEEKTDEEREVEEELNTILRRSPIIIFSKSYCPHSKRAKNIFGLYSITPAPYIVELDEHRLGPRLQAQLLKLTGRRTVPNILITGTSIGGGDDVAMLHEQGGLVKKIQELGGKRIMEARLKGVKEK